MKWVVFDNGICVDLDGRVPEKNGNPLQFRQGNLELGEVIEFPQLFRPNSRMTFFSSSMPPVQKESLAIRQPGGFSLNYLGLAHSLSSSFQGIWGRRMRDGGIAVTFAITLPLFAAMAPEGAKFNEAVPEAAAVPRQEMAMAARSSGQNSNSKMFSQNEDGHSSDSRGGMKSQQGGKAAISEGAAMRKSENHASNAAAKKQGKKLLAIIFDLDGVLVDSEPLHKKSFAAVFGKGKVSISDKEWYSQFSGTGSRNVISKLMETRGLSGNVEKLLEQRKNLYQSYVLSGMVKPMPGAIEINAWAKENGLKTIVASGSHRENVDASLASIGLSKMKSVAFEDAALQKPHPDLFLKAAHALGVPPSQCLVIEDSVAGVIAARRAGMEVLLISNHQPMKVRRMAGKSVKSLKEKSLLAWLDSLAKGKQGRKTAKKPWKYTPPTRKK